MQVLWVSSGNRTLDGKAPEWRIRFQACCAIPKGLDNICCLKGRSGPQPAGSQMLLVMMKLAVGRVTIFWWSRTTGCWGSVELRRCEQRCLLSCCKLLTSHSSLEVRIRHYVDTHCMSNCFCRRTCLTRKEYDYVLVYTFVAKIYRSKVPLINVL